MCKLQLVGASETKAVLDLCKWDPADFKVLLSVLELYESYETEDIKEIKKATVHYNEGKLARGEFLTMTNKMLISLSKVDAKYLVEESKNVLDKKVSLKAVIAGSERKKEMIKLSVLIEDLTGNTLEAIQEIFPDKFSAVSLANFLGAEVNKEKSNLKGEELKKYLKAVQEGKSVVEVHIKLVEVKDPKSIMVEDKAQNYDAKVFHFNNTESGVVKDVIKQAVEDMKPTILLFQTEEDQLDALVELNP